MVEKYSEKPPLALKFRSEDEGSVLEFIDLHHICLFSVHAVEAYENFISCHKIGQSFGPLRFRHGKHLFSTSHSLHFLCPCQEVG